ncbi:MAG: hypothetical protein ACLFWM_11055 [Actinomycetota bacterium]
MPWYWTDDLARTLIDSGTVDSSRVAGWLSTPVAIRRGEEDPDAVGLSLLEDEEGEPPSLPVAA